MLKSKTVYGLGEKLEQMTLDLGEDKKEVDQSSDDQLCEKRELTPEEKTKAFLEEIKEKYESPWWNR